MDRAQIRHVAELAELTLSEEEEASLTEEIGRIVAYVAELDAIDTRDVPPTAYMSGGGADGRDPDHATDELRPDEPRAGLSHEEALAGAPRVAHDGFSVPTFVE